MIVGRFKDDVPYTLTVARLCTKRVASMDDSLISTWFLFLVTSSLHRLSVSSDGHRTLSNTACGLAAPLAF